MQSLEEENNKLKITLQQYQARLDIPLPNQMASSNVESDNSRRTSGNLRILSRNSSKSELKKNQNNNALVEENELLQ